MADELQPPRKRGRPPKAPGESVKRPNVSLRLKQDLYDLVVQQARENGRSLSEEMEKRVEEAFQIQNIQENVSAIVERAVSEATEATAKRENEDNLEFFGGVYGFAWAKGAADLYTSVFLELAKEYGIKHEKDVTEKFRKELVARMKDRQDEVSQDWMLRIRMATWISNFDEINVSEMLQSLFKDNPKLREAFEEAAKRRGIPSSINPK